MLLAALLCAPALPTTSQSSSSSSQTEEQIRQQIDTYLGSIDVPVRPAQWRALGPQGASILEGMAQDPKVLPSRRTKAIDGLSAIGTLTAAHTMLRLAKDEQGPLAVRLSAVRGVGRVLPAQVAPALQPILQGAQNPHVRAAAADTLSSHGGCNLVRAQAAREDEPRRLRRALQRCGP
jgi:HEAT repeat protein